MRVLVTGVAGFIGFHCAGALAEDGHEILGIDNQNDYYLPALKQARIDHLLDRFPSIRYLRQDLTDLSGLQEAFRSFQPEGVLHLAAQAGVRYSIDNPHAYIQSNIVATAHILECCRHFGKPRLVYASSSSVYGGNKTLPFSEKDPVDHPISLYAATKKSNELMAHTYTHLYQLQTIGLRFFTVYGPWGRPDMAMWLFTDAIQKGRPIKVFNYGDMFRDFTFIDDIVKGVKGAMFSSGLSPYEIFNLGNCRCEKLEHLIELVEARLNKKAERLMLPMQDGDVKATFADIEKARRQLGFEPTTTLDEGVPQFIDWFLENPRFHGS